MDLKKFARHIRERRLTRSLTQGEIAVQLGVTTQTVSKWERGLSAPDLDNLIELSQLLSCTVDDLLCPDAKREQRRFIAIDGGGTKTEMLLFTESGKIEKRLVLGGSNPNSVTRDVARQRLTDGMEALWRYGTPSALFAGIAGAGSVDNESFLTQALTSHAHGIPLRIRSDILNVIGSVRGAEQCIAVICGTGSSVFSYEKETLKRFGGWGYLFDGAGSGYDIGRDVICACFALEDGFGKPSLVTELAQKQLGGTATAHLTEFYAQGRETIAALAPVAFEAYRQGDASAQEIIHRNLERLVLLIQAADNGGDTVILSGGLTAHQDILRPYLLSRLPARMHLIFPELPQIYGAALWAMKVSGVESNPDIFDTNFKRDYARLTKG